MSEDGLAVTPKGTTSAPEGMYEDIEAIEDVARGHVIVKQLIVYEFDRMEEIIDGLTDKPTGKMRKVEKSRGPYFCQTKEQEVVFRENNPEGRIETFTIQLLKSTAIKKLNDPDNMKQFREHAEEITEDQVFQIQKEKAIAAFKTASKGETVAVSGQTWRQQAKKLDIPLNQKTGGSRKKEDVLSDIISAECGYNVGQSKEDK